MLQFFSYISESDQSESRIFFFYFELIFSRHKKWQIKSKSLLGRIWKVLNPFCNVYTFSVWNCRTYLVEVQDKNKSGFISLILSFCLDNLLGFIYKIWKRCRKNVFLDTLMPEVSIRLVICYSKLEKRTLNYCKYILYYDSTSWIEVRWSDCQVFCFQNVV